MTPCHSNPLPRPTPVCGLARDATLQQRTLNALISVPVQVYGGIELAMAPSAPKRRLASLALAWAATSLHVSDAFLAPRAPLGQPVRLARGRYTHAGCVGSIC
jgi:hypothetical protein